MTGVMLSKQPYGGSMLPAAVPAVDAAELLSHRSHDYYYVIYRHVPRVPLTSESHET
jgi:hypothetical protein